ncbi:MAG: type II secretion system F family protein [Planctomycetota bacterium]
MTLWRYTAVPRAGAARSKQQGEMAGESAAAVRAALRQVGLQVIELRPLQGATARSGSAWRVWSDYLRRRRSLLRAELYDSLATLVESGLPLLEALDTISRTLPARHSSVGTVVISLREEVRSGHSLAEGMKGHPGWFDEAEVAMVEAGQHGGDLTRVLTVLAERHRRSGELAQRLAGALAYPAIVSVAGIGVLLFLSTHTLPDLVEILNDADIETPSLTQTVMDLGQWLFRNGAWIVLGGAATAVTWLGLRQRWLRADREPPRLLLWLSPALSRRIAVARLASRLAELVRCGVPIVEALRVVAPATGSVLLQRRLVQGADRLERGDDLATALDDEHWFDAEFRRLLEIGQTSGELDTLLERLGERTERRARRTIDRLATLLEPAAILTLAVLIGIVVMAAILPIVRLQDIL